MSQLRITGQRITTPRTLLAPITVEDADEMIGVLAGRELYAFIGGQPPSVEQLRARYAKLVVGHSDDGLQDWCNWVVRTQADSRAVGTVQATVMSEGTRAEVAWIIGLPWQGQGYASEAARAVVRWLTEGGIAYITAHVHPDHAASAAVARKAGQCHRRDLRRRAALGPRVGGCRLSSPTRSWTSRVAPKSCAGSVSAWSRWATCRRGDLGR
ncbi:MAG: GNAT family N-acetyltransferase [Pseudonocardiales bacterium]|nr:GNAT family N-acetyltransferase [Pseudonocardiales bacterium]